jgi:hypothetical protein
MCTLPLEFPPTIIFCVGCTALREQTEARYSLFSSAIRSTENDVLGAEDDDDDDDEDDDEPDGPLSDTIEKTSIRRGWDMLPDMNVGTACLGSNT